MARPSKSVANMKRHMTQEEREHRQNAEKAQATGINIAESEAVAMNSIAHREFERVTTLLKTVGKDDALFESIINRYCMLQAECAAFEAMREDAQNDLEELDNSELASNDRYQLKIKLRQAVIDCDKRVQEKRKAMFDIEKECGMTVASAARIVPKQPPKTENPLMEVLRGD